MISYYYPFLISHLQTLAVFDRLYQIKSPNSTTPQLISFKFIILLQSYCHLYIFPLYCEKLSLKIQYYSSSKACPSMPTCAKFLLWFKINFILSTLMLTKRSILFCASYPKKVLIYDLLAYIKHHLICLHFGLLRLRCVYSALVVLICMCLYLFPNQHVVLVTVPMCYIDRSSLPEYLDIISIHLEGMNVIIETFFIFRIFIFFSN